MAGFSTPIIVLVVVCFNTTLFASLGLYLWRQGPGAGARSGSGSGNGSGA